MSALTSLLVRDRIVPLEKIEEGIQKQVISGGELDTALLELGLVDENVIAAYCAATYGVLPATRDEIMMVGRDTIRVVPKEVAEKRRVVPLRAQEGSLTVAVSRPLPADVEQQLAFLLGAELVQRVVTEVRIAAALHHHYGLEMSPRHRRLVEKLRPQNPGAVPYVEPTSGGRLDPARLAGAMEAEEVLEATADPETLSAPVEATPNESEEKAEAPAEATPSGAFTRGPHGPVTARFGIPRASVEAATEEEAPLRVTDPGRKLRRGPMTTDAAARRLKEAKSRDEILETLLAFAEQFFDCTVLFTVRGQQARGRLASAAALTPEELRELRLPLDMPGTFRDAFAVCAPRLSRFEGEEADRLALAKLKRVDCAPAVVLPLAIRERVVILLYADRSGDDFNLSDVPEVLAIVPHATRAFSAVLMARKLGGFTAVEPSKNSELEVAPASLPPPPAKFVATPEAEAKAEPKQAKHAPVAAKPATSKVDGAEAGAAPIKDAAAKPARPAAFDLLGVPRSAPPPPMPQSQPAVAGGEPETKPTSESDTDSEDEPEPGPPSAGGATDEPDDEPELEVADDDDDDDWGDEDFDGEDDDEPVDEMDRAVPRPRTPSSSPASSMYMLSGTTPEQIGQPPTHHEDGRRESGGSPPREEVIRVGDVTAVTPPESPRAGRQPVPPPGQAKVIVNMGASVEEAVVELMGCGPGDEGPAVDRILRVGDAALPVLVREFPGPLWFDRHEPHRKLPRGRDVSAIGRALLALGERSISYLPTLIDARDTDRRFYATLLASETPHPELIPALGRRLFDDDAGVRALATDVLRLHAVFPKSMRTLLEGVRAMAKVPRADEERRVRAVDALGTLRDARSLNTLVDLLSSDSRPLRTAARWALVTLTRQDFGKSHSQWANWAKSHDEEHRVEWLMDALMHEEEATREAASSELKQITQQYHGYHPQQNRHDRAIAQRRYRAWWDAEGKALFTSEPDDI